MNFRPLTKALQDLMALFIIFQSISSLLSELYNCYSVQQLSDYILTVYSLVGLFYIFYFFAKIYSFVEYFFMCFKYIHNCFLKQSIMTSLKQFFLIILSTFHLDLRPIDFVFLFHSSGNCPSLESYG